MFLTPEQTGGPLIFALRQHDRYLAVWRDIGGGGGVIREFNIEQLAEALGRDAGETWQEHASLILLACCGGKLFERLNSGGE